MPLQPALMASKATSPLARNHFQFQITSGTIEVVMGFATKISGTYRFILRLTAQAALCSVLLAPVAVATPETISFAERAERAFVEAEHSARRQGDDIGAHVNFARAAFDWAEFARDNDQRAEIAERGIQAARSALKLSPTNAAAHYWLGMNMGQLARTKTLGALKLVREMEEEFLRARSLDDHVDYAGPDRSLGMLYRDAPGWPTSIGSKKKAREHLERSVRLHPEFPENQLCLAESYAEWDERGNLSRQLTVCEQVLTEADATFKGPQWEQSWSDWRRRIAALNSKNREGSKPVTTKGSQ